MLITKGKILLIVAATGAWQTGAGVWIHTKAILAQALLERAWEQTLTGVTRVRPWPWADTWPVARLRIPSRNLDIIVVQGDSGRSLAFGPGLAAGSSPPGTAGTTLISAHRDTHFRALADLQPDERIELETTNGRQVYSISGIEVLDARYQGIPNDPLNDELILATCYPFDALSPGGPLRYIVRARRVAKVDDRTMPGAMIRRTPACCSDAPVARQP